MREKATTGALSETFSTRGNPVGAAATNARTAQVAKATPNAPPNNNIGVASATDCAIKRAREAPSASRTANSPLRAVARVPKRVDRFTQAMSRRNETAPWRSVSTGRTSRTASSSIESTVMPAPALLPPYVFANRSANAAASRRA